MSRTTLWKADQVDVTECVTKDIFYKISKNKNSLTPEIQGESVNKD